MWHILFFSIYWQSWFSSSQVPASWQAWSQCAHSLSLYLDQKESHSFTKATSDPYTFRLHISIELRLLIKKKELHFSKGEPTVLYSVMCFFVGLFEKKEEEEKLGRWLRLLYASVKCEYCNRPWAFLPLMRAHWPQQRRQLKPAGVSSVAQRRRGWRLAQM